MSIRRTYSSRSRSSRARISEIFSVFVLFSIVLQKLSNRSDVVDQMVELAVDVEQPDHDSSRFAGLQWQWPHGSIARIVAAARRRRKMADQDEPLTAKGVHERGNELRAPEAAVVPA